MKKLALLTGISALLLTSIAHAQNITVALSWTDNSTNEDGFTIERSGSATGTFAAIGSTVSNVTTFSDPALSPNTQYCYRVYAFNKIGNSAYSNVACATTPGVPAAPGNVVVTVTVTP